MLGGGCKGGGGVRDECKRCVRGGGVRGGGV